MPFTSDSPTSPLHQRHRTDTIRARLGRIGEEATRGPQHGGPSAAIQKVSLTRDPSTLTFPLGAQTRRLDAAGRIKLQLAAGTLSDVLGWRPGTLEVAISGGWAALSQTDDLVGAPRGRCSSRAGFTVTYDYERICLRPAHLSALAVGPGDHVLVVAIPETGTLLMVHPGVCAPLTPAHLADLRRGEGAV